MKVLVLFVFVLFLVVSCNKEKGNYLIGTVMNKEGCDPNGWLVLIENPNPSKAGFLCEDQPHLSAWNCSRHVYIVNLPAHLAVSNKKIKFSKWDDLGLQCFSYIYAPHHLTVSDVREF